MRTVVREKDVAAKNNVRTGLIFAQSRYDPKGIGGDVNPRVRNDSQCCSSSKRGKGHLTARYAPDRREVCRSLRGRRFFPDYARCLSSESNGLSGSFASVRKALLDTHAETQLKAIMG
ncbi:hypothetical protein TNCT_228121 [Trichonephila clavata]|uniref:Uncharacterized protein n=1 Tax=Trichonephila clavata TaxID=2740835 RepID=A0A8X6LPH3_TRICU|nr:hypothetical protein TNCT_228121 [Trichonephila clavata]